MTFRSFIQNIYFSKTPLKPEDYEISRRFFLFEGSSAMGIFALTSGAFLAGFANYMGANDEFNGIIAAIPVLAGVVQILSSFVFEKIEQRKFLISILCLFFRSMLGLIMFIPLIATDATTRLLLLGGGYGVAYLIASFIIPPASNWIVDLTPEYIRGKYLAQKDAYSLAFLTIITILMGRVLDIFRQNGNEYGGFVVIGIVVFLLAIINFYCLSSAKEPIPVKNGTPVRLKDVLLIPLKNIRFRKIIVLFILWNAGLQVAGPFFAVYMVTGLKISYTYIMAMGVISSVIRVILAPYWGKLADQKSWFFSTKASVGILAITHFMWFFVNSRTAWLMIPVVHILGGIAWAGINISLFNIQFVFAPREGRTMYLASNAAVGGLVGFVSTLAGSAILRILEEYRFSIVAFSVSNMQIIFALSGLVLGACSLFVHLLPKLNDPSQVDSPII
jgi:Na+/melibiose symporter-like transporter